METKRGRPRTFNSREVGKLAFLMEGLKNWFENENEAFKELSRKAQRVFLLTTTNSIKSQIEFYIEENLKSHSPYDVVLKSVEYIFNKKNKGVNQETHDGYNEFAMSNVCFDTSKLKSPVGVAAKDLKSWFEETYNNGEKLEVLTERKNLLKGRYDQSDVNAVWCSDTTIREGLYLTLIIDTASRFVVGSFISQTPPTGSEMILFVENCMSTLGVKPKKFHSDQGSYYTCDKFAGFLHELGIEQSFDVRHNDAPGNQILESFNSKLWSFLDLSKKNGPGLKEFATRSFKSNSYLVSSALDYFNDKKDLPNRDYTPRALFEALSALNIELGLSSKSNETTSVVIRKFHDYAVQKREVDKLFADASFQGQKGVAEIQDVLKSIELRKDETLAQIHEKLDHLLNFCTTLLRTWHILAVQQKTIIESQETLLAEELKTREVLQKELADKAAQNALLNENLARTAEELALARAERERALEERAARRERRKNAEHRPLRAPVEEAEMKEILATVKGETPVLEARDRIAILLMFTFGLRISNLMLISVGQLKSLKQGHAIEIKQLKDRTNKPFRLIASATVLQWFEAYHTDFKVFFNGSDLADDQPFILLSREYLNRRINSYFKAVSDRTKKYIRSHSARITLGTKVVAALGITAAKNILGHKSIASTMFYDRNSLTPTEQQKIYDTVLPAAPASKPRAGRKQKALLLVKTEAAAKAEAASPRKRGRPKKVTS